jgi:hypothetical protein
MPRKPHLSELNRQAFDEIWDRFVGKIPPDKLWDLLYLDDDTANFVAEKKKSGKAVGSWGPNPIEARIREFVPNWQTTADPIGIDREDIMSVKERMKKARWI